MPNGDGAVLALHAAGVALIVDADRRSPRVLHWGLDLGPVSDELAASLRATAVPSILNNSPDTPRVFTVWPTEADGWSGTPAQQGNAAGAATTPRPALVGAEVDPDPAGGGAITLRFEDRIAAMQCLLTYRMDRFGVLAVEMSVSREQSLEPLTGAIPYTLDGLRALMPLPERAREVLDFTGKWCRERAPQRAEFVFGTHSRRTRRGKPGHDSPYLLAAGTPGFGFRHGEVWAVHLAWSGESEYLAERLPEGAGVLSAVLGAGEALHSGEVILSDGERYDAPSVYFIWSDAGLDGIAARLHQRLRGRPSHPKQPRPLVLNTWEAVYFDHDLERLSGLVDRAARVGVERIVLDDGWFHGRRGADAGLGDWFVDDSVWPAGLRPFVDLVRSHGMQFGLWFEPEMVNLDSDLARRHPDWVLGPRQGLGPSARQQYVLDISRPDAFNYLRDRVSALVSEYNIDYLKWDHNRDLLEAVGRRAGFDRPLVREQTLALYELLDELRTRHPALEVETCSGGGGRIDLGILERTDRLWASDCNDPVERLQIERWTRLLVPPELIGSHLGAARAHTTSRVTDLSFRLAVALTAHAGIEMDLSAASEDELAVLATWADLYREFRGLIHSGQVVNADLHDPAVLLEGVIAPDGSRALYSWARLMTSPDGQSGRVRFPGLDPQARYLVRLREELGPANRHEGEASQWLQSAAGPGVELPGAVLAMAGVPLPTLNPQQAMLFDLRRLP